ncbi:RNA-dependent RNA polymerase [Kowanyama virus]|uniref:RNA-directed RNA polymerase L n=1 Tax=Kowanyama virus TaxID=1819306 RepID=A0A142J8F2_9VIRU|nr:RNA-dependent RNA polymerase [Kowanyama virus]AMR73391.1 RNA-dependent RNA polymerase [Kowanyama virus]
MEDVEYRAFVARINSAKDATIGKIIYDDIMASRHDYFGRELCNSLGIQYRNDVLLSDILLETVIDYDPLNHKTPNITPDNYYYHAGTLYIIDYKVSVTEESTVLTYKKYYELTRELEAQLDIKISVAVIRLHPITKQLSSTCNELLELFAGFNFDINLDRHLELKDLLFDKFKDDEDFYRQIGHGDFTLTAPWCQDGCKELYSHPIYKEFKYSMPIPARRLFEESISFNPYSSERWNSNLLSLKEYYKSDYNSFINKQAKTIFEANGIYPQPNHEEIKSGWLLMKERVSIERNITPLIEKQKPSIHVLWSPPIKTMSNYATDKLIIYSKLLQSIDGLSKYKIAFQYIGKLMDISGSKSEYESFTNMLKTKCRSYASVVSDEKIKPRQIGTALVCWEQQFILNTAIMPVEARCLLLKDYLGIGKHKRFGNKTLEDINTDKPTILDFDNPEVLLASKTMMSNTRLLLSKPIDYDVKDFIYDNFGPQIKQASGDTFDSYMKIISKRYWAAINDMSVLIKNILSVSQYNKHNTFRVAFSNNNSLFALVFPSSDIKTKKATVVFCTVAIHKEKEDVLNCGALHQTFTSNGLHVSISKAIRLDKERAQRIVTSPGLFLINTMLLYNNNPTINLEDVCNFSFYTSLSITKAMLSLTEPSRYMIMNSLAISSNVKGYIEEKFSPYTKTLFSVYMTNLIKAGCMTAFEQRPKIMLRDVYLTDYEIKQKGIKPVRNLKSIWFTGEVTLKEYLNQIYLPFYYNAKGLHEKHHVMIDLAKTVLEIEKDQRESLPAIWSNEPKKQTVNLPILVYSIAKNLLSDTSRKNFLRGKIENMNNFRRSITTISTFTSSKSCIKIGNFSEQKTQIKKKIEKAEATYKKKVRLANPILYEEYEENAQVVHSNYNLIRDAVPNYVDHMSVKVFDRLYEMIDKKTIEEKDTIELIMDMMVTHKKFYFTFFNKGQKTAKDREIFVGEFEGKMCLYCIERISKERCKVNPDEMISEPGDGKLKAIEIKAEQEIRFLVEALRKQKKDMDADLLSTLNIDSLETRSKGLKLEINADMSKWSAQDVLFKYFWLVAMDPLLYPQEKERILYFLCNYMQKELILPDELLNNVLDQQTPYTDDIIMIMTNNFKTNTVNIKRNWLQGNLNYTSSYIHSCAMSVYKDILSTACELLEGSILVNSLVHSDDNQTSIAIVQNKLQDDQIIQFIMETFESTCLTFGNQVNMKKTYLTNFLKEFVSLFNLYGEPFSIFGRFLLTSVGDCAYIGPYEDLSSRLSAAQTALKHGAPPSLIWLSIGVSHWVTYMTYNMLPGQANDPMPYFPAMTRRDLPIEIGGVINSNLTVLSMVGLESGNLTFLLNLLRRMTPVLKKRETIQSQVLNIDDWDLTELTVNELFYLKFLRYIVLDTQFTVDESMGETSDMRSKSLLTPRKFTTIGSLRRLYSFTKYQDKIRAPKGLDDIFLYMLNNPELLVTKGETYLDFCNSILYRFNSKRFKESLSIQNPAQLFIEQVLFSKKPVIDFTGIREKYLNLIDQEEFNEKLNIIGKVTYSEAFRMINSDLTQLPLEKEDIKVIYDFIVLNDPLMSTIANSQLLSIIANPQERLGSSCNTMPEFRNLKLIRYSPALVIRAYNKGVYDFSYADPKELERDVFHLKEFVDNTGIKISMDTRIAKRTEELGERDFQFELKELTSFYQVCYSYIKSTEHKIKVYILPGKAHTAVEFCSLIMGNLECDDKWFTVHYLKPISSISSKGQIQRTCSSELNIASEAFRLIAHFADTFVGEESRLQFLHKMINEFSYKDMKVADLYNIILRDPSRIQYLPILYKTGHLEQKDIDRFDALKNSERVTWNQWQISRTLDVGTIDLIITGQNRQIAIKGNDDRLSLAELRLSRVDPSNILYAGRKLLNARHGLKFEKFQTVDIEPNNYYITCQFKYKGHYTYQITPTSVIARREMECEANNTKLTNRLIPVCLVNIAQVDSTKVIPLRYLDYKNRENFSLSRLEVAENEVATVKKASFVKMSSFAGPELRCGFLDLSKLMNTPELLSSDYHSITKCSLISLAKVLACNGTKNLEEGTMFFSDDPMEELEVEEMSSTPLFNIKISKRAKASMSYKSAIIALIEQQTAEFQEAFCWDVEGFFSGENLGILESLVSLMKILKTNEWSTLLDNCIHICLIKNGMDALYHNFNVPEVFLKNKYTGEIDWANYKDFIIQIPEIKMDPWSTMFEHFREKSKELISEKLKPKTTFEAFKKNLRKSEGRGMFDFF